MELSRFVHLVNSIEVQGIKLFPRRCPWHSSSVLWKEHSHKHPKPKQLSWVKSHHGFAEGRRETRPSGKQSHIHAHAPWPHSASEKRPEYRYSFYPLKFIYTLLRCMVTSAIKKRRPKKSMFWASPHLSCIPAVPSSKSKGQSHRPGQRCLHP